MKLLIHKIKTAWRALTSSHVVLMTMDSKAMEDMIMEEEDGAKVIIDTFGHFPYTQMLLLESVYCTYVLPNIEKEKEQFFEIVDKQTK